MKKIRINFTPLERKKIVPACRGIFLTGFMCSVCILAILSFATVFAFCEEFEYNSHGKKDPFASPVIRGNTEGGEEVLVGVLLEGILLDENKPMAIINGKILGVGDKIGEITIVEITSNEVVFRYNDKDIPVQLRVKDEEDI